MAHLDSTPPARPSSLPARVDGGRGAAPTFVLRWSAGRPVVALSGEIDVSTAAQLRSVHALLDRHGQRATVEASGVTFMDVAGLRALLELASPAGSLLVVHPSAAVLRLLDLLRASGLGPHELRAGPREDAVLLREPGAAAPTTPSTPGRPAAR